MDSKPRSNVNKVFARFGGSRKKSRSLSSGAEAAEPPMPASLGHSASSAETALSNVSSGSGSSYYSGGGAEAATRSMAEVAIKLDHFFENMEIESTESDVVSLSRSIQKAECYSNAYLANQCQLRSITLGPLDQRILNLGALSVREVYVVANETDATLTPLAEKYTYFEPTNVIEKFPNDFAEGCGIVRAATVRVFDAEDSRENTVVVALRGPTLKRRDWSSGEADVESADSFIGDIRTPYSAHANYLRAARSMAGVISDKIESVLSEQLQAFTGTKQMLLFTGHSAGGAVAALLYAHATSGFNNAFTKLLSKFSSVHCITFGAPPVTSPPLPPPQPPNTLLSVCNDGDPVPRGGYGALAAIYTASMDESAPTSSLPYSKRKELPAMQLHNAGTVGVLVRDKPGEAVKFDPHANIEMLEPNPPPVLSVPDSPGGSVALKGTMQGTIMPNPRAHDIDVYLKRLRLLEPPEAKPASALTATATPSSPTGTTADGKKAVTTSAAQRIAATALTGVSATGAVTGTSAGAGAPSIDPSAVPAVEDKSPVNDDSGITIEKLMAMSKLESEAVEKAKYSR